MAPLRPAVFWFFGLSGAGKTTLTRAAARELTAKGLPCQVLDGDEFRKGPSADLGYSAADRAENIRRAAVAARAACEAGQVVLAAFITPTAELRQSARAIISPLPFHEVFLECDYATGASRDVKGLYAKAAAGHLKQFTGNDAVFEPPAAPDLRVDTQRCDLAACLRVLLPYVERVVLPGDEPAAFRDPLTNQIATFLRGIGLPVWHGTLGDSSFLPGIQPRAGGLVIDETRLLYPGDLLHEAGHLAVMTAEERARVDGQLSATLGDEMGAIIWSYAAALHLGIDPAVVFHPHGYRGSSEAFLQNFREGRYIAVPLLQWMEMTCEPRFAAERGCEPFPHMLKWLRS